MGMQHRLNLILKPFALPDDLVASYDLAPERQGLLLRHAEPTWSRASFGAPAGNQACGLFCAPSADRPSIRARMMSRTLSTR